MALVGLFREEKAPGPDRLFFFVPFQGQTRGTSAARNRTVASNWPNAAPTKTLRLITTNELCRRIEISSFLRFARDFDTSSCSVHRCHIEFSSIAEQPRNLSM